MRTLGARAVFYKTTSLQNDMYTGYFFKLLRERIRLPKGLMRKVGKCGRIASTNVEWREPCKQPLMSLVMAMPTVSLSTQNDRPYEQLQQLIR